jgi:hypothetical protein
MEEARAARAQMLQRKQRIEQLVTKRIHNVNYLKKFHEGDHYWMNLISMSKEELQGFAKKQIPHSRVLGYFYLGMSLSKIFDELSCGPHTNKAEAVAKFIRSITQLVEEFEFYFSSSAMQSVKYVMAKNSQCMYPHIAPTPPSVSGGESGNSSGGGGMHLNDPALIPKPNVFKYQSDVVYEFLLTPHIPFADSMDYVEVLSSLCEILLNVYKAFQDSTCYQ